MNVGCEKQLFPESAVKTGFQPGSELAFSSLEPVSGVEQLRFEANAENVFRYDSFEMVVGDIGIDGIELRNQLTSIPIWQELPETDTLLLINMAGQRAYYVDVNDWCVTEKVLIEEIQKNDKSLKAVMLVSQATFSFYDQAALRLWRDLAVDSMPELQVGFFMVGPQPSAGDMDRAWLKNFIKDETLALTKAAKVRKNRDFSYELVEGRRAKDRKMSKTMKEVVEYEKWERQVADKLSESMKLETLDGHWLIVDSSKADSHYSAVGEVDVLDLGKERFKLVGKVPFKPPEISADAMYIVRERRKERKEWSEDREKKMYQETKQWRLTDLDCWDCSPEKQGKFLEQIRIEGKDRGRYRTMTKIRSCTGCKAHLEPEYRVRKHSRMLVEDGEIVRKDNGKPVMIHGWVIYE